MVTNKDYEKMKDELSYYKRKCEEYLTEIIRLNRKNAEHKENAPKSIHQEVKEIIDKDYGNEDGYALENLNEGEVK